MLDDDPEEVGPIVEDIVKGRGAPLKEDIILETKVINTRRGTTYSYRIGQQGQRPRDGKWYSKEDGERLLPQLHFSAPTGVGSS